ncbi:hypothetical protein Kisp01_15360 [Kineosporia sp. NBRC 101677]|nr:hypothetical protein Kisp01_15360 [Kineosporia sp. NBRC 101677]
MRSSRTRAPIIRIVRSASKPFAGRLTGTAGASGERDLIVPGAPVSAMRVVPIRRNK